MQVLFCWNPDMRRLPDPAFELEYDAAKESGLECRLFGQEEFFAGMEDRAFSLLPDGSGEPTLYRGWSLTEGEHRLLADALRYRVGGPETDFTRYEEVARRFCNPFITIDVARTAKGDWLILEAGDGGVSALPPRLDAKGFYTRLRKRVRESLT